MANNQTSKQDIHGLFIKFLHQQEQYEARENEAFLKEFSKTLAIKASLNMTEIHVIACIGHHEPLNLTSITDKMELSKGNISKVCTKLLKEGFVRKTQLSDNKKEVYFRLTPLGKKLYTLHEDLHTKAQEQLFSFLDQYNETELEFVNRFLADIVGFLGEREAN
jgi:DNA-binding MarR family transcriptional regulator